MALTEKQKRFVQCYVASLNATHAYRKAYGHDKAESVCAAAAARLLNQGQIQQAIEAAMEKAAQRVPVTKHFILSSLLKVYERCMQIEPVLDSKGQAKGQFRFHAAAANQALALLGKHLGLCQEGRTPYGTLPNASVDRGLSDIERRLSELSAPRASETAPTSVSD